MAHIIRTRDRQITISESVIELTMEDLMQIRAAIWGGNAIGSNPELMRMAATKLRSASGPGNFLDVASTLQHRADFVDEGIKRLDAMINALRGHDQEQLSDTERPKP